MKSARNTRQSEFWPRARTAPDGKQHITGGFKRSTDTTKPGKEHCLTHLMSKFVLLRMHWIYDDAQIHYGGIKSKLSTSIDMRLKF